VHRLLCLWRASEEEATQAEAADGRWEGAVGVSVRLGFWLYEIGIRLGVRLK
jgi:hypothetical protein